MYRAYHDVRDKISRHLCGKIAPIFFKLTFMKNSAYSILTSITHQGNCYVTFFVMNIIAASQFLLSRNSLNFIFKFEIIVM